jgi:hypothetical protein
MTVDNIKVRILILFIMESYNLGYVKGIKLETIIRKSTAGTNGILFRFYKNFNRKQGLLL